MMVVLPDIRDTTSRQCPLAQLCTARLQAREEGLPATTLGTGRWLQQKLYVPKAAMACRMPRVGKIPVGADELRG